MQEQQQPIRGVIFDLDGTVYCGDEGVPGVAELISALAERGIKVRYATNRSSRPATAVYDQLRGMGIACQLDEVMTAADATADTLKPGRVYLIGEAGIREALASRGFTFADEAVDYVVVSFDRKFNFDKLARATQLIINGAKFIATNTDRSLPLNGVVTPGSGALVAAVVEASCVEPTIIGKPFPTLFNWVLREMQLPAAEVLAIGDNLETDIPAGAAAGMRTMLVLTGIAKREDVARAPVVPTWLAADYDEVRRIIWPLLP